MTKKVAHHIASLGAAFAAIAPSHAIEEMGESRRHSTELSTAVPYLKGGLNVVRPVPVSPYEVADGIIHRAEKLQRVLTENPKFAYSETQRYQITDRLTRAIQLQMKPGVSCVSMTTAFATTAGNVDAAVYDHTAFGLQPGHPFVYIPRSVPSNIAIGDSKGEEQPRLMFQKPLPVPEELDLSSAPNMVTLAASALKHHKAIAMPIFVPEKDAQACARANLIPFSYGI